MARTRWLVTTALAMSFALGACSDDPSAPGARTVVGVSALAIGSTSIRLTFNSRSGDDTYNIERAEGLAGVFAQIGTVDAPAITGQVTYTDGDLDITTLYRYRVITVRGAETSAPSAEVSTTTLDIGNATADITADISASRTLYADTVYTLKGFIHVVNAAVLTIQPGTKIQGDFNTLGSSLFIMRGSQIQAVGTAEFPIVFTSSRGAGSRQPGDWGGLIIVGNAPINRTGTIVVEGTGTNVNNNYNVIFSEGNTPTDNSGTLAYVRVEFAGYAPSTNNELNAFTFAGVGSGTRGSYLQTLAALDDAFEWFGGSGDYDHLVAYETSDDMFDMSTGFTGRLQYLIGYNTLQIPARTGAGSPAADPQGIENDNCNPMEAGCAGVNAVPLTIPVVANFTLIGTNDVATSNASGGIGMMLRRGTGGYYVNGVVARFPRFGVSIRDAETYTVRAGNTTIPDLATADLAVKNVLFADVPVVFQTGQAGEFELAGNSLTASGAATASLFTLLPAAASNPLNAAAFDWTPAGGSAIASGGMSTFTGKLLTAAGAFVTPTTYLGAADPAGAKWWAGWTIYARN
ncbi:MAG TPA: fibronectin type III domain-containing protein [Gemmatimonadaceae bacterium]|nr:fibronectin type III domain-containing protein [Gemmatimonadaceae bacterium]